jgi:hypothetical protein
MPYQKIDELTDRLTERLSHERTSGVQIINPADFKCFRKMEKSDYQLRHVLSVRPHGTTRLPLARFS